MLRHMFTSLAGAAYFWVTDVRWLDAIAFRDCFCVRPLSSREGSRNENRIQILRGPAWIYCRHATSRYLGLGNRLRKNLS